MDPNACLKRWLDAIIEGDDDEAEAAERDLRDWLQRGCFQPDWNRCYAYRVLRRAIRGGV